MAGNQVVADIGRNLNIESVQDTSTFKSKDQSIGGSMTVGVGFSGSVSASQSKVNADYASVGEQSGISAGDGGFQINVKGNTDLKGAQIASTDKAMEDGKNSLTTGTLTVSEIENRSQYQAESQSASVGGSAGKPGGGIGIGSTSGSETSVTRSGVTGAGVTIADAQAQQEKTGQSAEQTIALLDQNVRTGKDSSNTLNKNWSGDELRQDVEAQAKITQAFGQQAAKAVGDIAGAKRDEFKKAAEDATRRGETELAAQLNAEAKNWDEGGIYRVAIHTAIGALSGGIDGALGAAASAQFMPTVANEIKKMGLSPELQGAVELAAAAGIGAMVGGTTGAASGFNVELNNRQLTHTEKDRIKELAKGDPDKEVKLTAAACAAVKCYAEYPKGSVSYAYLEQLANYGNSADLANERALLAQQQGLYSYSTNGIFNDKNADALRQINNTYNLTDRGLGALQGVLGTAAATASAVGCLTPATCAFAFTSMGINLDYANAGFLTMLAGQQQVTLGERALSALGMSKEAAAVSYAALGLSPAAIESAIASKAINEVTAINNASRLSYTSINEFSVNGLKVTPETMKTTQAQAVVHEYIEAGATIDDAYRYARNLLNTGRDLPQLLNVTKDTELIKLVPKTALAGDKVSDFSPFFITRQEYDALSKLPVDQIASRLGLPAEQAIRGSQLGFDVYAMKPIKGDAAKAFSSEIAPVQQGNYFAPGGAQQVLVPNRSQWTVPEKISSLERGT